MVFGGAAARVNTGIADRDQHLRTDDFFAAEKNPEIRFESTRIERSAAGYVAHGTLTMRGVTKPVDFGQLPLPRTNQPATTPPTRSYGWASVIVTRAKAGSSFGSSSMPSLTRSRPSISGA